MPLLSDDEARAFIAAHNRGVLVTLKRSDGRPQLSNVRYGVIDGHVRISVTDDRAKTANLRRDPRVSLHVTSDDFWTYVVAEGDAQLSPVARTPGDETCRRLLAYYEAAAGGPHPDPEEFFQAMVDEHRLEVSFAIGHLYPVRR
ncbi:MAG TPA: PPOX class F420-dependent oxidoreductase [Euzebyales bacterium]|nr:PPOX class F420-dependent oxidoreductase [Euzebyales bacterium]